jgi:hypothetical protein
MLSMSVHAQTAGPSCPQRTAAARAAPPASRARPSCHQPTTLAQQGPFPCALCNTIRAMAAEHSMFQFLSHRQQAYEPLLPQSDRSQDRPARGLTRAEREHELLKERDMWVLTGLC